MRKFNNPSIFLGPSFCEKCSGYTIKRLIVDRNFHAGLFVSTLIPIITKKQLVICDCCNESRKPNDHEKKLIDLSKKNMLDNEAAEERFLLVVDQELVAFGAYDDKGYYYDGIKKAANSLYDHYSTKQGYDYDYYSYLCEIYAITNHRKLMERKIKYGL